MISRNILVVACVVSLVLGYLAACVPGFDPINPFVPHKPDRPVARLLSRLARLGLWVMVFAEPPPNSQYRATPPASGEEGTFVCHAEGW